MSVQRYIVAGRHLFLADKVPMLGGEVVIKEADHARIVAEALDETVACCRLAYEQGKAEIERAHAAALAEEYRRWRKAAEDVLASWPRTLTADDPEPAVTSVGLDRDQSVWQRVGSTEHSRWVNPFMGTREWSDVLARGPVRLIHDGEDR